MEIDYDKVPVPHMRGAIERYIEKGIQPGGFMTSLLSNGPIFEVLGRADGDNSRAIKEWLVFIYNDIPGSCWGSEETVEQWCRMGGLQGMRKEDQA